MKSFRVVMGAVLIAGLAACSSPNIASRNAPFESIPDMEPVHGPNFAPIEQEQLATFAPQTPMITTADYKIVDYQIKIPESLSVSEANLFYPVADIVWRGDPMGNRKQQIGAIFQESITRAAPKATGTREVKAYITLNRFHSLTEKTRFTVGGVHSISFYVTLADAKTGDILVNYRKVKADLKGFGGMRAMRAESQGLGMKTRIQDHLARVLTAEFTQPNGWGEQDIKLSTAIDQI